MAILTFKDDDIVVNTINDRDLIPRKFHGMIVFVKDATGDVNAGPGLAIYEYDQSNSSWNLLFKANNNDLYNYININDNNLQQQIDNLQNIKLGKTEKAADSGKLNGLVQTPLNTPNTIVSRDNSGNFSANVITGNLNGNANTATKLQNARTITINGDVQGSTTFDGSNNVTISATVPLLSQKANKSEVINNNGNYLVKDNRSTNTPTNLGNMGFLFEFKQNSTDGLNDGGTHHGVLTFQQWHDSTGGTIHQLAFTDNNNLWIRNAPIGGVWGPWKKIWHSENDGSGSGLDADKLDGLDASQFIRSDQGTKGDLLYFNGTSWVKLPKGDEGQILTIKNGVPTWINLVIG